MSWFSYKSTKEYIIENLESEIFKLKKENLKLRVLNYKELTGDSYKKLSRGRRSNTFLFQFSLAFEKIVFICIEDGLCDCCIDNSEEDLIFYNDEYKLYFKYKKYLKGRRNN